MLGRLNGDPDVAPPTSNLCRSGSPLRAALREFAVNAELYKMCDLAGDLDARATYSDIIATRLARVVMNAVEVKTTAN